MPHGAILCTAHPCPTTIRAVPATLARFAAEQEASQLHPRTPSTSAPVVFQLSLPMLTLWSLFGDAKTDASPLTINVHLSLQTDRSLFRAFMFTSSELFVFWNPCTCPRKCLKSASGLSSCHDLRCRRTEGVIWAFVLLTQPAHCLTSCHLPTPALLLPVALPLWRGRWTRRLPAPTGLHIKLKRV